VVPAVIGWTLFAIVALGLVAVGGGALAAPRVATAQYGIVVEDPRALAFVRAMGVRDLVIGLLLGLLAVTRSRQIVADGLYVTCLIALVDFVIVAMDRAPGRARGLPPLALHTAGVVGFALAGAVLQAGY